VGIISAIKNKLTGKKVAQLGSPILTAKEEAQKSGGYVSTSTIAGGGTGQAGTPTQTGGIKTGDITKVLGTGRSSGSSSSSRTSTPSTSQTQIQETSKQSLTEATRQLNKDLRNTKSLQERNDRTKQYLEERSRILSGQRSVSSGRGVSSAVTRDIKTGEIKRTEERVSDRGNEIIIKQDYSKEQPTIRIDTYEKGRRTGGVYAKEITEEVKPITEEPVIEKVKLMNKEYTQEVPVKRNIFTAVKELKKTISERTDPLYYYSKRKGLNYTEEKEKGTWVGGVYLTGEEKKKYEELPSWKRNLVVTLQPSNILLGATTPKISETKVFFTGVKTEAGEGFQRTTLKFLTSAGQKGEAVGVSKVGSQGKIFGAKTNVLGYSGRQVVDLTGLEPRMILKDVKGFGAVEESIGVQSKRQFVGVSQAEIRTVGSKEKLLSTGSFFGETKKGVTNMFGASGSKQGVNYFLGKVKDIAKKRLPSKVSITGRTQTSFAKTFTPSTAITEQATKSAVTSAVGGNKIVTPSISIKPIVLTSLQQEEQASPLKLNGVNNMVYSSPVKEQEKQIISLSEKTKSNQINFLSSSQEGKQREKQKSVSILEQPQVTKEIQREKQIEVVKNMFQQKQTQEQKQKQEQIFRQMNIPKTPEPNKPITKIPTSNGIKSKYKSITEIKDEFKLYERRYGKDILKGEFQSKEQASKELEKALKSDLGRSGFIEEGGKRIPFEDLKLSSEFTPSKKESGRVVQKAKFSLGTGSETREIQSAKKTRGKKIRWL
jgi:hypothetical protein